jgi:dTMP kinase
VRIAGRGCLITLEGIEGAGKSTQVEALGRALEARGIAVVLTREPGGTALGEALRALLIDPAGRALSADAEALLIWAARAEHLAAVIRPALEAGRWVLCDRFTDATYAYQGGGRRLGPDRMAVLEDWVLGPLRPDRTLLLDLPAEEGLRRAGERSPRDRFESEAAEFFERVRAVYLERAAAEPDRVRVVDASAPPGEVTRRILAALEDLA